MGADRVLYRGFQKLLFGLSEDGHGALNSRHIAAVNEFSDHVLHPPNENGNNLPRHLKMHRHRDAAEFRLIPFF